MSSHEAIDDVSDEVKQIVSDIIAKNNLKQTCTVKYYPGSQAGDGYTSKTYAVDITDDDGKTLNLFLKCALDIDDSIARADLLYSGEIYFYKTIYPTYKEFSESKGVKNGLQIVPFCYGYNEKRRFEIVALENLRIKGYTLFDKRTCMNDEHLKLTLRSFAKFHAVSFAMKDQRKELHEQFCERSPNLLGDFWPKMMRNTVKSFIGKLDAKEDKDILARCVDLDSKVYDHVANINNRSTQYSILTKGDCNINNMMISYENDDREHPKGLMLVDWQGMSRGSPIHDFGGLFYSVAPKEAVDNYRHYWDVYHGELSTMMKALGSDPEVLYPRSVFEKEWVEYGLWSLGLCLVGIKGLLSEAKDMPTLENNVEKKDLTEIFAEAPYDEVEFLRRARYIARHMIDIGVF